jgi:tetratricopeptide (TPR) repeat protein
VTSRPSGAGHRVVGWVLGPVLRALSRRHPGAFGALLLQRFEATGNFELVEAAEEMLRKSLLRLPEDSRLRGMRLSSLGVALRLRSELTGNSDLLAEAEAVGRAGLDSVPGDDPWRVAVGFNLAATLLRIAERDGDIAVAEEAVALCRTAADASEPDTFELTREQCQGQLGMALFYVFLISGDFKSLEEAVETLRSAADDLPAWHLMRAGVLGALAQALARLADRTGDGNLLQEAADAAGQAMDAVPPGHPYRAGHVSNLAKILMQIFEHSSPTAGHAGIPDPERTGLLADALDLAREAMAGTPTGHSQRAVHLANLGAVLLSAAGHAASAGQASTAGRGKGPGDRGALLREAVDVLREAVAAAPDEHPMRASYLNNLGLALRAIAIATVNVGELADAARAVREAIAAVPDDHPNRAEFQVNLAAILWDLAERTADASLPDEASALDVAVAASADAPTLLRIAAYRRIAAHAVEAGQDTAALAALEAAIDLAPRLAPRTLQLRDREDRLASLAGLASEAATAALAAGWPERAVELLEQTRGVLFADLLDARGGDLDRLAAVRPDLAGSVAALRDHREALDGLDPLRPGKFASDPSVTFRVARDLAADRRSADEAWDDLIARIREIEGFAGFFGPPRAADLAARAGDGPVVFVSVSPARGDALIVTGDPDEPVRAVPLTDLRYADVIEQVSLLSDACGQGYAGTAGASAQASILRTLAWIWDTIAHPVLEALGYDHVPESGEAWPRLWWCPVGPLAYLPLHAAGHHDGAECWVMDRVISSYTPTLRSLGYARSRRADTPSDISRSAAVIVAVPAVPGVSPLPAARSEARAISALVPGARILEDPAAADVLAALAECPVAHFACHAYTHWASLGASRLVLRDYATAPLTVANISRLQLPGVLAYLSACSTAVTGPELADESVHVASAFHLAGYQHVVGTLWPVGDRLAARLAEDFYRRLTGTDPMGGEPPAVAEALHHAVRSTRTRQSGVPAIWAAYIHIGI